MNSAKDEGQNYRLLWSSIILRKYVSLSSYKNRIHHGKINTVILVFSLKCHYLHIVFQFSFHEFLFLNASLVIEGICIMICHYV